MRRVLLLIACLAAAAGTSGCVLWPHTTDGTPEVRGRVIDARTQTPVYGAKIFISARPSISAESDITGHFRLKGTRSFHLAYVGAEAKDWPAGVATEDLTISHSNYLAREFVGWQLWDHRDTNSSSVAGRLIVLRDVNLEAKP